MLRQRGHRVRVRQHEIANAELFELTRDAGGQVTPMAQETPRGYRQVRDQLQPFAFGQLRCRHRGGGRFRVAFRQELHQRTIAQPQPGLAQDPRLVLLRQIRHQLAQPRIGLGSQVLVAAAGRAEKVQQLPELRAQHRLASGAHTQHGGKAIVELHSGSGTGDG